MYNSSTVYKDKEKEAQEKKHKETCAKKSALRKNKKKKVLKNQFAVYPKSN